MKKIWRILYMLVALLPKSNNKIFGKISNSIRCITAKRFVKHIGYGVNLQKNTYFGYDLSIGDYSSIGIGCVLGNKVTLGNNVMMGPEVIIYTRNHEFKSKSIPMNRQGYQVEKPVSIGNDVWIGARTIILPGVKVGNGVIIGAGSIVTKNFQDYSIIAGNPAKFIRYR